MSHGPTECNAVALTFDAGADRGYAEQILRNRELGLVPIGFLYPSLRLRSRAAPAITPAPI